jgi:hypothetical protein
LIVLISRIVFRCSATYSSWVSVVPLTGEWVELLRLHSDEQVAGDPVLAGHWFVVCTRSKARTRVLLYQIAKANLPIVRLSVEIEGPANASVRLDSFTLAVADDFGRLQVFELTYGERIRDIRL